MLIVRYQTFYHMEKLFCVSVLTLSPDQFAMVTDGLPWLQLQLAKVTGTVCHGYRYSSTG